MTLHEAITQALINFEELTYEELADVINKNRLYQRNDREPVPVSQLRARVSKHVESFRVEGDTVKLKPLGLQVLKSIIDKLRELFLLSRTNPEHLQEMLLPTFAVYLKYSSHLTFGRRYEPSDEDKITEILDHLREINKGGKFSGLLTPAIELFRSLENYIQLRIIDVLRTGTLQFKNVVDLDYTLPGRKKRNFTRDAFSNPIEVFNTSLIDETDFIEYFNYLTNEYAWKKRFDRSLGSTPPALIELITSLVEVKEGDIVFDPFFGKGSTLISLSRANKETTLNIVGGDLLADPIFIAQLSFAVNNLPVPTLERGNAFTHWIRSNVVADWFISNPPLGLNRIEENEYKSTRGDIAIVNMALRHTAKDGRACIILQESFIDSKQSEIVALRRQLVENNYVDAIIALPAGLFAPFSNIKTVLLILDKTRRENKKDDLFLYDAGHKSSKDLTSLIPEILGIYRNELNLEANYTNTLPHEILDAANYSFSVKNWKWDQPIYHSIDFVPLSKLIAEESAIMQGHSIPKDAISDKDGIPFFQISDLKNSTAGFELNESNARKFVIETDLISTRYVHPGMVLIAKSGLSLKPSLYVGKEKSMFSQNVVALKVNENKILTEFLIHQFHEDYIKEQIDDIRKGSGIPYFNISDLLTVNVFCPTIEEQKKWLTEKQQSQSEQTKTLSEYAVLMGELLHKANTPLGSIRIGLERLENYLKRKAQNGEPITLDDCTLKILPGEDPANFSEHSLSQTINRLQVNLKRITDYMQRSMYQLEMEQQLEPVEINLYELMQKEVIPNSEHKIKVVTEHKNLDKKVNVIADKNLLLAVFDNLIDNAYVHGFNSNVGLASKVNIYWEFKKISAEEKQLLVFVENNGKAAPGLTKSRFITAGETTNGDKGGMGIGGAFINKALMQMGGELVDVVDLSEKIGEYRIQFVLTLQHDRK